MMYQAGWLGTQEIVLIVIIVLLLFGGKKIPELAKGLGKGIREFKKSTQESDIADDLKDIVSEVNDIKKDVDKMNPKKILQNTELKSSRKG